MSTGPVMDPATLEELRRLARARPRSGRPSVAKASAIRTLDRLAREPRRQPMPPMPEGWYPYKPGDPFYELDRVFLHERPAILQRHWRWRGARGECECPCVATAAAPRLRGPSAFFQVGADPSAPRTKHPL
jgi:hypothetical protein